VYIVFRGRMLTPDFSAGEESLEVRLFKRDAVPWNEIAFPVVENALRRYVEDAANGTFRVHAGSLPDRIG
ncbi:MAG TPA: NUDIX hydrolase, partial [Nitrospiraceae bacterium]